jgi:hypothetical protein
MYFLFLFGSKGFNLFGQGCFDVDAVSYKLRSFVGICRFAGCQPRLRGGHFRSNDFKSVDLCMLPSVLFLTDKAEVITGLLIRCIRIFYKSN